MRQRHWMAAAAAAATLLVLLAVTAQAVVDIEEQSLLFETFGYGWEDRWVHSSDSKYNGRFKAVTPDGWTEPGLQVPDKNRYYGISSALKSPLDVSQAGGLVVQYELRYDKGVTCGGAYLKLVTQPAANEEGQPFEPAGLRDDTPYSIMFGPDKCGDTNKVHLILRHRNPLNGTVSEKHLKTPPTPLLGAGSTNLYTLKIKPDATYQILINGEVKSKGSLLEALEPPINPPATVPDPTDVKPANWVDDPKMPDPDAVKPSTWDDRAMVEDAAAKKPKGWLDDEPAMVDDPSATQPDDWVEEDDGTWEAPQVPNPKCASAPGCGEWKRPQVPNPAYKGAWEAPLVDNPEYKGPWVQRRIPNPDFYEDSAPLSPASLGRIGAVAIEIWTIDEGYTFDNIVVAQDEGAAAQLLALWKERAAAERAANEAKQKEEDDKAARLKDKAAKKAAKQKGKKGKKASANLAEVIVNAFDDAPLSALKPYLGYPLQMLQAEPWTAYLLASAPPVWLLIVVVACSGRGRRAKKAAQDAAQAKKDDITGPNDDDDEVEEDEGERRQKAKAARKAAKAAAGASAADGQGSSGVTKAPKAAAKEAAVGEIAAGDEDDEGEDDDEGDEGEGAAGVRRRRRQA